MATAEPVVSLIAACDTKQAEVLYVKERLQANGAQVLVVDIGVLGEPYSGADVTREQVAAAGGVNLKNLVASRDKAKAMKVMAAGAAITVPELMTSKPFDGVIGLGGTAGTSIASAAMRALPFGLPKVLLSTVASGDTRPYLSTKDIVLVPSIVDLAGVNTVSRMTMRMAVGTLLGMISERENGPGARRTIAATMFGNTTPLVDGLREQLTKQGHEVLVFHCTGIGGQTMEELIEAGLVKLVLDVTTTELADELGGGVFSAGPHRLEAASKAGVPQVVAPGCLDMINFSERGTVPQHFTNRPIYEWNPQVTLVRTTPEDNSRLGKLIAAKLNRARGPVRVIFPLGGFSQLDAEGGPFWWPQADTACLTALRHDLRPDIQLTTVNCNINDDEFRAVVLDAAHALLSTFTGT